MKRLLSPVFWVCFVIISGTMGTALISPLYGLYKVEWSLQPSDIAFTYVIYMLGALLGLLVLGRLPDKLGYRNLLVGSVLLAMAGTVLTMLAPGLATLLIARFLVGVASSIATSAGSTALKDQVPERDRAKIPLIFSLLLALGFGIGPLVGGLFGQFASHPLLTAYLPTLFCGALALVGFLILVTEKSRPTTAPRLHAADLIPKLATPGSGQKIDFLLACGSPLLAFSVFGLYASMAPLFIEAILHIRGPLLSGISIMAILLVSAITQLFVQRFPPARSVRIGILSLALSNAALILNLSFNSVLLFVVGVFLTATGHGCALLGSFQQINRVAAPQNLSGLTSTYLVIGYLGSIATSFTIGWLANFWGVAAAVSIFGATIIAMCLALMTANTLRTRYSALRG